MRSLFLIPARGGSKGLPRKNVLEINGKPLINYTIDAARGAMENSDVLCVSSDDSEIIRTVEDYGVEVPFVRPNELATDTSSTVDVINHALNYYKSIGMSFDSVVLLQVTSPLRKSSHITEALELYSEDIDMVTSVKLTDANPFFVLFQENEEGCLEKCMNGEFDRRQDCPDVFELNGAVYVINVNALGTKGWRNFSKIRKYVMPKIASVDIDDEIDFLVVKTIIEEYLK